MAQNHNHIDGVHFTKLSFRQQDNYHPYINIMISSSYHLVASPPILLAEAIGGTRLAGSLMYIVHIVICFILDFYFFPRAGWRTLL